MEQSPKTYLALGLMSGTSADGIDAALIRTDGESYMEFVGASTTPYTSSLRNKLLEIAQKDIPLSDVLRYQKDMTMAHVGAISELLGSMRIHAEQLDIIGFHGHTIRHLAKEALTWQIGDASLLSHHLQTPVVHDFRRLDMAAGGQGAPLVPLFHQVLCRSIEKPMAMLNLGGVGNLTWLGQDDSVIATDTGPGCGLIDAWTDRHFGIAMDQDGRLASQGTVDNTAVESVLAQPFFRRQLPKSADRFEFDASPLEGLSAHDGLATLCAITARSVARVAEQLPSHPRALYVTGGGSKHPLIMAMLEEWIGNVHPVEVLQQRSDSMEAECFAWLAVRRLRGFPTSVPTTTGCLVPTSGGSLTGRQKPGESQTLL